MSAPTRESLWLLIHRYLGLATLLFLLVASITGCLLCYKGPIDAALNADLFRRPAAMAGEGSAPLQPLRAVAAFEAAHPHVDVTSFPLSVPPGASVPVTVSPRDLARPLVYNQVFLGTDDGRILGHRTTGPGWDRRHIMSGVFSLHYTLLAETWGRWLMGVMAGGWLIGNLVGLYLSLPKRAPFWRNWWPMWTMSLRGRLPKVLLDMHRATGLWLFIGVCVLAFTSVAMNFFDEAVVPAVQVVAPPRSSPFDTPASGRSTATRLSFDAIRDHAVARAQSRGLPWLAATASYIPDRNLMAVAFTSTGRTNYQRLGPTFYFFDAHDGRFIYEDNPYQDSAGRQFTRSLYPLHSGQIAGPIGVLVVLILGLATAEMCISGAYVWWKKRRIRVAARRTARGAKNRVERDPTAGSGFG